MGSGCVSYLYLFEWGVVTTSEFAFFLDFLILGRFFDDLRVFLSAIFSKKYCCELDLW